MPGSNLNHLGRRVRSRAGRVYRRALRNIYGRQFDVFRFTSPLGMRTFHYRDCSADRGVIEQMFVHQDYSLSKLRRGPELMTTLSKMQKPLILDLGSNIGASVCWYSKEYPRCHVTAFEPDGDNFRLLSLNTQGLNVDLRRAAIGSMDGKVRLIDPGQGEWGYRTDMDKDGSIDLVSISRLVDEKSNAGYDPFIAKIDIEGAESDLFKGPCEWVDRFPLLIVELHDWLMPGEGSSRSFLKCIAERDRDFVFIGENVFSIRNGN